MSSTTVVSANLMMVLLSGWECSCECRECRVGGLAHSAVGSQCWDWELWRCGGLLSPSGSNSATRGPVDQFVDLQANGWRKSQLCQLGHQSLSENGVKCRAKVYKQQPDPAAIGWTEQSGEYSWSFVDVFLVGKPVWVQCSSDSKWCDHRLVSWSTSLQ